MAILVTMYLLHYIRQGGKAIKQQQFLTNLTCVHPALLREGKTTVGKQQNNCQVWAASTLFFSYSTDGKTLENSRNFVIFL